MKNYFYSVMLLAALAVPLTAGAYDFSGPRTAAPDDAWLLPADEDPSSTTDSFCCSIVGFEATFVNLNSVALRWAYNIAYGYNHNGVTITLHDNADGSVTHNDQTQFVDGTHCFFTGLLSGHYYTATARTVCGNDTSHPVSVSFYVPVCGTVVDGASYLYNTPMSADQPYSYHQMLLPVAQYPDSIINGISFKVYSGSGTMRARIYMANTDRSALSPTGFVPFDDLQLVADSVSVPLAPGWVSIPFDVPFYSDGRNMVVAIHNISGTSDTCIWVGNPCENGSVYCYEGMTAGTDISTIDSMQSAGFLPTVQIHSECNHVYCLPPNAMVTSVAESQIQVAWVPGMSETAWTVEYYDEDNSQWQADVVTDTGYTFTSLAPGTPYQIRIGALCGGDTLYTALSARTSCLPIDSLPWSEDFDSYTNIASGDLSCWQFNAHGGRFVLHSIAHGEGRSVSYNRPMDSLGLIVLPAFDFSLSSLTLSFWTLSPDYQEVDSIGVGYLSDVMVDASFVEVTRVYCEGESWSGPWQFHEVNFPFDDVTSRIALRIYGRGSVLFIDDITVSFFTGCRHPEVTLGEVGPTSIELHLSDPDSVFHYMVSYSDGTTTDSVEVMDSVYLITGLTPDEPYTITVSTLCSDNTVSAANSLSVTTACAAITSIPYTCDFETTSPVPLGTGNYPLPRCWSRVGGTSHTPYVIYGSAYGGGRCLYFADDNAPVVLPEVDTSLVDLSQTQLSFYARSRSPYYPMRLAVIAASDPTDRFTYRLLEFISIVSTDYRHYQIPLTAYRPGMGGYILLEAYDGLAAYIDNLSLEELSSCTPPIIREIICENGKTTISWVGNGTDFCIYYRSYDPNDSTAFDSVVVSVSGNTNSVHTLTIDGLSGPATYQFFVRGFCPDSTTIDGPLVQFFLASSGQSVAYYSVSATSANAAMGYATCSPGGTLEEGTEVVATATPSPGHHFSHWTSAGTFVSNDNPYTFTVTSAIVLTANFEPDNEGIGSSPSGSQPVVGIHPNPSSTSVTISGIGGMNLLSVIDISGRTLFTQTVHPQNGHAITLDVSNLAPGTYFVRLTGPRQTVVGKLIVK